MPMFFQILTPTAPWSNDRRRTAITRSAKSRFSKSLGVERGGPSHPPSGNAMHFGRPDQLLVNVGGLGADGLGETDGETPPPRLLKRLEHGRSQAVNMQVGIDSLE